MSENIDIERFNGLVESKQGFRVYDVFEPSLNIHIGQGLLKVINVYKMLEYPDCEYIILLADTFAKMNLKFDGDLEKIKESGENMISIWEKYGLTSEKVKYVWSSKMIEENPTKYWSIAIDISTKFTESRIKKCIDKDTESLKASQVLYPIMQCADIFHLGIDVCQMGLDQRKVNMLAREYSEKMKFPKPVIYSHPMIPSLRGKGKMSKSVIDSSIFMNDTPADIDKKISKAFCEEKNIGNNPILEYFRHILYPFIEILPRVSDLEKFYDYTSLLSLYKSIGKNVRIETVDSEYISKLEKEFLAGTLTPQDLKNSSIDIISAILRPVYSQ